MGSLGLLSDTRTLVTGESGSVITMRLAVWGVWFCYQRDEASSVGSLGLLSER